jgi:hypothetical protein
MAAVAQQVFEKAADWSGQDSMSSPLLPLRWLTRDSHDGLGVEVSQDDLIFF